MKEIKFRAWDEDGEMFTPTHLEFLDDGRIMVWQGDTYGELGSAIIALMQYTGLKDKKGVEIYEGDILKMYDESLRHVKWQYQGFYIAEQPMRNFSPLELIVIGNIYENPELSK